MSIRDQILNAKDTRLEPVDVPEWGCTVYVPVLSLEEMQESIEMEKASKNGFATTAVNAIRDAEGRRVFTIADVPALAKKSMAAVSRINLKFNQINGLVRGDDEKN